MDIKRMLKPRFILALLLAAALCFVFMLSPLANVFAEQPDGDDIIATTEDDGGDVLAEDPGAIGPEPEPDPDLEPTPTPEPEPPQPPEGGGENSGGPGSEGSSEENEEDDDTQTTEPEDPSRPEFVPPEYDPQPADAEEALALWQAALAEPRVVMWEFELPEDCIPVGARQEFVLLDEESGTGYWTLYASMRAMAAVTKTVSNETELQNAINAAAPNDVLNITISAGFDMTKSIVIDKNLTVSIVGNGPVMLHMTENYVRHFDIQAGTVKLYFRDVELNGLVPDKPNEKGFKGGGFNVHAGADVYLEGVLLTQAATGSKFSGYIPGGGIYVAGRLEIADSYFDRADVFDEGGIAYVAAGGTLVISGTAAAPVRMRCGNATNGGGIYVEPGGTLQAEYLHISAGTENPKGTESDAGSRVTNGSGGGIYWNIAPGTGEQYLINSVIQDCFSSLYGGAAYIDILDGGVLQAFDNNYINNNTGLFFGAVYLKNNGTVNSFNGNSFNNNSSRMGGAALYADGNVGFAVTNTAISNHRGTSSIQPQVAERGSAIYSVNPGLVINGEHTQITNNLASINGGAIYVAAGTTTFSGGSISSNTATGDGGGVYVAEGGSFVQTGGDITGNKGSTGGGIYIERNATAKLEGGSISGNTTSMGGGLAVYNFGRLELNGTRITGHEANGKNGTVMLANGASATMSGGEISGNRLTSTSGSSTGNGAGVYVNSNAFFTMTGGSISGNQAVNGAGVYVAKGNEVMVTGGSISGNEASGLGGGIYLEQGNELVFRAEGAATISGNSAPAGGAVYSDTGNTISLAQNGGSLLFDGNKATDSSRGGGAFYLNKNTALAIYGGSFTNNTATGDGGAIYLFDASVSATISGGSFGTAGNGNRAEGDGGAIFNSAGELTLTAGRFEANGAGSNGGAISSTYGKNTFAGPSAAGANGATEPYIYNNTAALYGGGVYVSDGILGMKNTALEKNTAQLGGGMYVAVGGLYDSLMGGISPFAADTIDELVGNRMAQNHASYDGGGMYVYVSPNGVSESISGNQFLDNTAGRNGGGLYVAYYGVGKRVSGNTVRGNEAGGNGGGLYVEGTMARYFAITDDTVENNTAKGDGGGVYVYNTILRVYDASALGVKGQANITNNKATNGGGIYAAGYAKVIVEQGTLSGNAASGNGGGIYSNVYLAPAGSLSASTGSTVGTDIYEGVLVDIGVANLTGNTATGNGGGVYVGQRGGLNLTGTSLAQNVAANGGGVYIATFGVLDINKTADGTKTSFTSNIARTGNGGGLYVGNGTLSLQYALLTGNKAEQGNGGGAYVVLQADNDGSGEAQRIIYNEFKNNDALNGGGLHITIKDGATSRVVGGNLVDTNTATGDGGGVWISFSGEGKSVYFNTIQNNTALRGGGVYITGTSKTSNNMSFTNDKILNNVATEVGGGIMVDNSTLTLFDAEATNAAKVVIDGKLVEYNMLDGSPIMGHTLIEGNSAPNGGGIFLNNSILYLQNGVINNNTATYNGGGINAGAGSVIQNYDPYQISPEYRLVITNNTATHGDGGGMYLVPQEDLPQRKQQYELSGLVVQGNKALNGDGGGIYADKPLLQYLFIENSTFGDPGRADGELYNEASTYVKELNRVVDADYITIHGANLSALQGLSPNGSTWAVVSDQDSAPLYYNNYDIAFHAVPPGSATVTYHGNGGYFTDKNNTSRYSEDVTVGKEVMAPTDTKHSNASFVGWYENAQTITDILNKGLIPSSKLSVINGALGYETIAEEAVDFYAAWLPPPTVDPAYDSDTEVVVYTLQNITEVSLSVNGGTPQALTSGYQVEGSLWKWTFTVSGLAEGMPLEAIQTITVPGGASTVDSPKGNNTVLPTHGVIYHINAPEESTAEQGRLEAEWKPTDSTRYRSSEDEGADAVVLDPQANAMGRENYDFLGWQASGSGKLLDGGDTVTVYGEDVHLYAQWEPLYTLTYDANISINLDEYLPDGAIKPRGTPVDIKPWKDETDPKHPGQRFLYWTNDRAGNSTAKYLDVDSIPQDSTFDYDASLVLNQNRTLFAKWQPLYQVTYELNYEGAPPSNIIDAGYYAQNEDQFPVSTEVPQREGYTFTGWHYYQNPAQDESKWYTPGESYLMNEQGITLYAQWERNVSIRYEGNGSTGGEAPAGEPSWPYRGEYTIEGHNTLQKDGYNFLGWALTADATEPDYKPLDLYYPTENTVFYAVWTTQPVPPIIQKRADVVLVDPGETFHYTLVVLNNNSTLEVEAVVVDTLPDGLALVESDTPYTQNGQAVTFAKTMPPESEWTIRITVKLDENYTGGAVHNIAAVTFNGDDALTDTDFELTSLRPAPPAPEPVDTPPAPPAPEPPAPAPTPKTGDESYIALWVCLAVVSFGGMCGLTIVHALYRRRRLRERYKWYYRAGSR